MGAPKLRWTPEEEAALKAGIARYGLGKWSTILKDPELGILLHSRSNVDLKDKWRNISVMTNGWGFRQRVKNAFRNTPLSPKLVHNSTVKRAVCEKIPEVPEASRPLVAMSRKPISRLDDLVVEAISKLNVHHGSDCASIAWYIEERYSTPSEFESILAASLKLLTEKRRLIKVKNQYMIGPSWMTIDRGANIDPMVVDGAQKDSSSFRILTKANIDAELDKMRMMTVVDAAAAAAKAVAEAEAALIEAETAAREAEEAEAEAEAAQCFAEAAKNALNYRLVHAWYLSHFFGFWFFL